jgi:putative acyl-CoA dehydrogenase
MCLDVLRALSKDPATTEALLAELQSAAGADRRLDGFVADIHQLLPAKAASGPGQSSAEYSARVLTEKLALALQASLVMQHSSSAMAEAFIASRLSGHHGQAFGTLPSGVDVNGILGRGGELAP